MNNRPRKRNQLPQKVVFSRLKTELSLQFASDLVDKSCWFHASGLIISDFDVMSIGYQTQVSPGMHIYLNRARYSGSEKGCYF